MKKAISLALAASMALSLAACGGAGSSSAAATGSSAATSEGAVNMLLIQPTILLDELFKTVTHSIHQVIEVINRNVQFVSNLVFIPSVV